MQEPIRNVTLGTQLADTFRQLIVSRTWPVGQKIPSEHELALKLGVSRATVREALRALSIAGLLEPRVGDGTYVLATDEISGVLAREETSMLLEHVLDARAGLEAASARLAARQASSGALDELAAALVARTAAHDTGDMAAFVTADADFHRAVVFASGNPVLIRLYDAVAGVNAQSVEHTATLPEQSAIGVAHARLTAAIIGKNVEGAPVIAYELIDSVKDVGQQQSE